MRCDICWYIAEVMEQVDPTKTQQQHYNTLEDLYDHGKLENTQLKQRAIEGPALDSKPAFD